ncbi:MAG: HAMP domain-containing protein, partial [Acetobacteraceae bacterium]|nr:HAMP domain-containing protein [Acetobacteraceae bacterium]
IAAATAAVLDDLGIAQDRARTAETRAVAEALAARIRDIAALAGRPAADLVAPIAGVVQEFEAVTEAFLADGYALRADAEAMAQAAALSTQLALGASLLVALLTSLALAGSIVPPLRRAASLAAEVAEGRLDTTVRVPSRPGRNETSQLIVALARMQAAIREDRERIKAMAAAEEAQHNAAHEQRAEALRGMADAVERETLSSVDDMARRMQAMREEVETMASAIGQMADECGTVAGSAQTALGSAETVGDAAEQLTMAIREISRHVAQAASVASRGVEHSEQSRTSILGLAESVSGIGAIASSIREIAERTNLLALNATIEAARAGEAGRGFAVVASEVKALAAQTARATEDIGRRVQAVSLATEASVARVADIASTIAEMNETSTAIAAAVEQQSAATGEIAGAVRSAAAAARDVAGRVVQVVGTTRDVGKGAVQARDGAVAVDAAVQELRKVLVRIVRTATPEVDRRNHPRIPLDCRTWVETGRGRQEARVEDISIGGARLALPEGALIAGGRGKLHIDRGGVEPLDFTVISTGGGQARLRFELSSTAEPALNRLLAQFDNRGFTPDAIKQLRPALAA